MKPFFRCLFVLVSLLGFAGAASAQTTVVQRPDCFLPFGPLTAASAGTSAGPFDNRTLGCNTWQIDYNSFGFTVISLLVQVAPNATGNVPGTWATFTAIAPGINPNTATTQAVTTFGSTTSGSTTAYFPWLRVQLTTATGTGSVSGVLYGWKIPAGSTVQACPGTVATPCVVVGPTAAGSAPTTSPVLIAGQDGAPGLIRTIQTDSSGRPIVVGSKTNNAAAPGATNVGVLPCLANAAAPTWTEAFEVLCSVDLAGNMRITGTVTAVGNKTNNAAAPGATNVGALICLANAAAPTWTEAFEVLCSVDLAGNQRVMPAANSTALADGVSNTANLPSAGGAAATERTFPFQYNGSTWDRQFVCASQARVTLSDATRTQLVALSGSTVIRVCHIHMSTTAAEDFTISYGTGSACGTGTATIDKYLSVQAFAMDFQPTAALRTIAANALCVTQSAVQSAEVTVIYAQF